MAIAYGTQKYSLAQASTPVLARFTWRMVAALSIGLKGPDSGIRPQGMKVSQRGWRRNSALLMALHQCPRRD